MSRMSLGVWGEPAKAGVSMSPQGVTGVRVIAGAGGMRVHPSQSRLPEVTTRGERPGEVGEGGLLQHPCTRPV